ncbi:hypothetical protein AGLY_004666 [Aphis glycines]|uniref:Uncharacterized protein n=1 Tax=Aphis glycines TaxID=307491 RepID=A0A6G0TUY4_APHGL|nr:hypothetical protein AGLY_004666 [Aphis glycines]
MRNPPKQHRNVQQRIYIVVAASVVNITSRNNAPISNYGGGFRCKSEYPWCIIETDKSSPFRICEQFRNAYNNHCENCLNVLFKWNDVCCASVVVAIGSSNDSYLNTGNIPDTNIIIVYNTIIGMIVILHYNYINIANDNVYYIYLCEPKRQLLYPYPRGGTVAVDCLNVFLPTLLSN